VWLGEFVARLLRIEGENSRFLLRMFINLAVYGKLAAAHLKRGRTLQSGAGGNRRD
jgi:hypothetical protein